MSDAQTQAEAMKDPAPIHVYIFWDHSNIFIEARNIAEETEMELGDDVGRRVRLDFNHMLVLAHENRPVAAGSVPPVMQAVWLRLEQAGVKTEIFDRSVLAPDLHLQKEMLRDAMRCKTPGTVILLTGTGRDTTTARVSWIPLKP